jgi:hypothetical protein
VSRRPFASAFDVPYVGEVIGYEDAEIEAAFWNLPGGRVLELIEYLVPAGQRVDMETYSVGNAHLCLTTDDIHGDVERLRGVALLRSEQAVEIPWGPFRGGVRALLARPRRDYDRALAASAGRGEPRTSGS